MSPLRGLNSITCECLTLLIHEVKFENRIQKYIDTILMKTF